MKLNLEYYKSSKENEITELEKNIINKFFNRDDFENFEKLLDKNSTYDEMKVISEARKNIISFYPIGKKEKVLEIGANFGEITEELCKKAQKVVSIESKLEKAEAVAKRHCKLDNLEVFAGELKDIELKDKFDYIILIGNLNYKKDIDVMLEQCEKYLNENGKLVIAINNNFVDEYLMKFKSNQILAIDKSTIKNSEFIEIGELEKKLEKKKFINKLYYPMPDYIFTNAIYSDEFLPNEEHVSSRYWEMFDGKKEKYNYIEKAKLKEIVKKDERLFKFFTNSYLIIAQKGIQNVSAKAVTYGMFRNKDFRIKTVINEDEVVKTANNEMSQKHIYKIKENINILKKCGINTLDKFEDNCIISKFIKNELTLDKIIINLFEENKKEEAINEIKRFKTEILDKLENVNSTEENVFDKYFIEYDAKKMEGLTFKKNGIFDLIFQNCFVINGEFYVYDQEWNEANMPAEFILYRALKNLPKIKKYIDINEIYEMFNIKEVIQIFDELDEKILANVNKNIIWEIHVNANSSILMAENKKEEKLLEEKDTEISELKKVVFDKEVHIQNLENEIISCNYKIKNYENTLTIITNSLSWKITKPLRYFSWMFNPKNNATLFDRILPPGSRTRIKYDEKKSKKEWEKELEGYRKATDEAGVEYWKGIRHRERLKKERDDARENCGKFTDYEYWMRLNDPTSEELDKQRKHKFKYNPKISIVIPLYNTPEDLFRELLFNMYRQTYRNWELCLADGSDEKLEYIEKMCKDQRIHYKFLGVNKGISGNSNEGLKMVTGDYVALLDHDDLLHQNALFEVVKVINEKRDVRFIYTDEDKITTIDLPRFDPHFKPDFSPDSLRNGNYICHFSVFKKEVMDKLEGFRSEYNGAQDLDIILRMSEIVKPEEIYHIPKVLYSWRICETSTAGNPESKLYAYESGKKAVQHHIDRLGLKGNVERNPMMYGIYITKYEINGNPLVNILIPNKNNPQKIRRCVDSIISKTNYKNYEIDIIDDNSNDEETIKYYKEIEKNEKIKVLNYGKNNSNYAKLINYGVQNTTGDFILQWNVSNEIIEGNWLEIILGYAQNPEIGAVGGKILDKDNNIVQANIVVGGENGKIELNKGLSSNVFGYMAKENQTQNVSCVGKNMMICKRKVFEEAGKLSEDVDGLEDVDFCLAIRKLKLLNVYIPTAIIYSETFEEKISEEVLKEMKSKWSKIYLNGDEYYNKNFSIEVNNYGIKKEKVL